MGRRAAAGWRRRLWPPPPDRTTVRLAYVLAVIGLILAAIVAALAVGAFQTSPAPPPFGGNGAIAYDVGDLSSARTTTPT